MIIGKRVAVNYNENYIGTLVAFGIGFCSVFEGIGHYTEAIVMKDGGEVCTCPVNCITVIL